MVPVRKKLPHTIPQWVAEGSWFFITINCVPSGKNQLCRADIGNAVLDAMKYNHERFAWHCCLCLLMPDHLHAIIAFPREPGMAMIVKNWKKFVAGEHGVNWQRDFFDHRLRDHHELEEKTSYILMNPVRKGLCEQAEDWEWVYRPNDRPPPRLVGRAVPCTPSSAMLAARTHSTSLRASCDAPYR
jgi:putative transposase